MPPGRGSGVSEVDGVPYSFAMEYRGPPIAARDLPRAVPIKVDRIPVASVVSQVGYPDKLSLPVVQPISASDFAKKFSKEFELGAKIVISPVSVMEFEQKDGSDDDCVAKEKDGLGSGISNSTNAVSVLEEARGDLGNFAVSGELSSSGTLELGDGQYGSSEFSDVINTSTELETPSISHSIDLLAGGGSSGTLGFSDSFDQSRELSGSSVALRASNGCKESLDFNDLNEAGWISTESELSSEYPSSRVSSHKTGNYIDETTCDERHTPAVTFRDVESVEGDVSEEYRQVKPDVFRLRRESEVKVRKGACYRCFKGYRFTEKEVCIVCDAKYCINCVLRAMGSMPEGRKCVTCIGFSIDESKRGKLGKCSRMLKRLLNDLEVRQVMKSEKLCFANQLPSEYVCVNGKPLCSEELVILQNCLNPPKKLKPGNYWYDKVSGLWGKEGEKPSKIISPHLNVGGPINIDASNGNTGVYINGREITKIELRMLQLAGVQCAGNPHFWVNDDGSYQEEGQKNTKGYIWGKARTKLLSAVLSLPVPSKSIHSSGEQVSNVMSQIVPDYLEKITVQKLLLIGYSGSGTSTIFKQAKILYKDIPFGEDERENIKLLIQTNVYGYLCIILEGRERFEDESLNAMREDKLSESCENAEDDVSLTCGDVENNNKSIYSICPRLKAFSDWLLKIMATGNLEAIFPAATREYAPIIEELLKSEALKATYSRRGELEMLPSIASYFLERAVDILRIDYIPSDVDILYAEGVTSSNGLACADFAFPLPASDDSFDTVDQHDSLLRFQLIRVQARGFAESCKWLEMFEDVRVVIFCVALSDFDQFGSDGDGALVNKMLLSRKLFESIVTHPTFDQMDFLLILNKCDLFEDKIEHSPLTRCEWFDDFHPLISSHHRSNNSSSNINYNPSLGQLASHYVAVKFKRLFSSLTDRKLYVSLVNAMEPDSVDESLKYAREILKWDEERANFSLSENTIYSTEASSFSQ
ncbi:Extra-large guanine nucleotide-binding protein 1 [Heracleum sosnowskyi]|uniref:Extra-large guanine nucleotide-binding protein 1 n=1 Tax=Heracleum sosnowskyi TaxID=360622 RepID=A0AAD8HCP0_9APIA|nr:Extra-large guanine nucleotide-binding protein 1 [Heracleum sosnowskyi]